MIRQASGKSARNTTGGGTAALAGSWDLPASTINPPVSKAAMPIPLAVALYMEAAIAMAKIDQSAIVFVGSTKH